MGFAQQVRRRLPRYCQAYIDNRGKPRHYLRRRGHQRVPLPGLPWSPEFMAAYQTTMASAPPTPPAASRAQPGTMAALVIGYRQSLAFTGLKVKTRRDYSTHLDQLSRDHADKRVRMLRSEHVVQLMSGFSPTKANALRNVLRVLMRFAIEHGWRADDPTQGVRRARVKSEGHHSWTEDEIEAFEARHPTRTQARLALALLLYTGQRRGDVVTMGWQHLRAGVLRLRQSKTGTALSVPVHPALQAEIDAVPRDRMTFLITQYGTPFQGDSISVWFRRQCDLAGLPKRCSAHGLRKAAARRLAEAGCTAHEIASITGHKSLAEIERYTAAAEQARLATAAIAKVISS